MANINKVVSDVGAKVEDLVHIPDLAIEGCFFTPPPYCLYSHSAPIMDEFLFSSDSSPSPLRKLLVGADVREFICEKEEIAFVYFPFRNITLFLFTVL